VEKHKQGLIGESTWIEQPQRSDDTQGEGSSEASNKDEDQGSEQVGVVTSSKRPPAARKDGRTEKISEAQKQLSLRDLTREAYSRASLHTYKSGLHRNRGGASQRGHGTRVSNSSAGGTGRGTGGSGQPNMKLRMGAMLEKIMQDYS